MTDIRLPIGDTVFTLRAVILCVRDGRLLTIRGDELDFKYLPGGAVGVNESTIQAAGREWTEETGLLAGPLRFVGTVENFFEMAGQCWHEVGFYYRMDSGAVPASSTPLRDQHGQFWEWVELSALAQQRVYPLAVSQVLEAADGQVLNLVSVG